MSMFSDVAVLQDLVARDAVADDMVDRGADGPGEAAVAERRGDGAVVADEIVAQPVQFSGRDARFDIGRDEVQRFGGKPAGTAHAVEFGRVVQLDERAGAARPVVKGFGSHGAGNESTLRIPRPSNLDRQGAGCGNPAGRHAAADGPETDAGGARRLGRFGICRVDVRRDADRGAIFPLHQIQQHRTAAGFADRRQIAQMPGSARGHGVGEFAGMGRDRRAAQGDALDLEMSTADRTRGSAGNRRGSRCRNGPRAGSPLRQTQDRPARSAALLRLWRWPARC